MMKKRIVTIIVGVLFFTSMTLALIFDYESLDVITSIIGIFFGLVLLYFISSYIVTKRISIFTKKIKNELLIKDVSTLDDSDRYVYYAFSYILNPDKNYTEEELKNIRTAFLILGALNSYEEPKKNALQLAHLKMKAIEFYTRKKENRFKSNFFFDKNELFFGWGISYVFGFIGVGLFIGANAVFHYTDDVYHLAGWLMALFGSLCVISPTVKICILLEFK